MIRKRIKSKSEIERTKVADGGFCPALTLYLALNPLPNLNPHPHPAPSALARDGGIEKPPKTCYNPNRCRPVVSWIASPCLDGPDCGSPCAIIRAWSNDPGAWRARWPWSRRRPGAGMWRSTKSVPALGDPPARHPWRGPITPRRRSACNRHCDWVERLEMGTEKLTDGQEQFFRGQN